jgi:uncharacterized membrane protein
MSNTESILKTILAIAFLLAATLKIFGFKYMKEVFEDFKLNRLAMILFGMIEILFVIVLFIPKFAFYACVGFAYISASALYRHVKAKHPLIRFIPTVVLLILTIITAVVLLNPN